MRKKIIELTSTWDWKSIRNGFLITVGLSVFLWQIVFGASNNYSTELEKLESITKGNIVNIETMNTITHSREGSSEMFLGYKVTFEYSAKGSNYSNTIILKAQQKECRSLRKLYFIHNQREFEIKYQGSNPQLSLINFKDE